MTVRFTPVPAHVRTARLVAAAVARRSGVEEAVLDEVRLAVGEACSRAVDLHRRYCPDEPVTVSFTDGRTSFSVEVVDLGPEQPDAIGTLDRLAQGGPQAVLDADSPEGDEGLDESIGDGMGLAVIAGLVDDLDIVRGDEGLTLRMSWPLDSAVGAPLPPVGA